jgi:hypothetical protein
LYDLEEQDYRHDDNYLARTFKRALFKNSEEAEKLFQQKKIKEKVEIKVGDTVLNFEYGWQNGTYNLIKPVSFDLKRADSIQKKAFQHYGQSDLLLEEAKANYRVDYLVARPIEKGGNGT